VHVREIGCRAPGELAGETAIGERGLEQRRLCPRGRDSAGWTRDYLFFVQGYVKDMDFYAAHAQTVTPLPFRAMGTYPYPETIRYPEGNREYLLEWNTREVGAEAWPSYRFAFKNR